MKKWFCLTALTLVLLLAGCSPASAPSPTETAVPETTVPETTVPPTTAQPETLPPPPASVVPESPEAAPDVEDVILYFNEVCLDAEFINSGNPNFLQKWEEPILYQIHGSPTEEDLTVLTDFAQWLNTIPGFPGIREANNRESANLQIHFCSPEEMVKQMGSQFSCMDGAVTFWYDNNVIFDAIICIRNDIGQTLRNSVILEEIYNGLGPVQDTDLRPDSIIYAGYSEPQSLTEVDKLLLKLLYHPDMRCGMNAAECEEVIRTLYK